MPTTTPSKRLARAAAERNREPVTPPVVSIRAFREFVGESLQVAADRISRAGYEITKSGLGNIETGVRGPSKEFLDAWSRAYGGAEPFTVERVARPTRRSAA